jgi:hypothetical protein
MFVEMPRDNRMAVTFARAKPQPLALPGLFWPFGPSPHAKRSNISQRLAVL